MPNVEKEQNLMNNLSSDLKKLEKEEQINSKITRRKKIIKVRADISEVESA